MRTSGFSAIFAVLAASCLAFAACDGIDDGNGGAPDADADTDGDAGADTDSDADGDVADAGDGGGGDCDENDNDCDGYTGSADCNEGNAFINVGAIEDLGPDAGGDDIDNDCDGLTDEVESYCDCESSLTNSAADLLRAMELCDARFVLSAQKLMTSSGGDVAFAAIMNQGSNDCIIPKASCEMAALSSGPVGESNPNNAEDMGGYADIANDPKPQYQGDSLDSASPYAACDRSQLRILFQAPTNAKGFSFDFIFGSAEYNEWIDSGFNDTFYAIMEYADLNGGATTNISFDNNGNEIEVDSNYFENTLSTCDETGSGWEPTISAVSGSTGWLRTTWSIAPGSMFRLTFSIHDEGDCIYDSIVFIDNFKWSTEPVTDETVIVD